jgi:hypothetical protein
MGAEVYRDAHGTWCPFLSPLWLFTSNWGLGGVQLPGGHPPQPRAVRRDGEDGMQVAGVPVPVEGELPPAGHPSGDSSQNRLVQLAGFSDRSVT